MQGYPWLSIQEQYLLDPTDPFSQMFAISNNGYIPLTNMDVQCAPHFVTSTYYIFDGFAVEYKDFCNYLGHAGTVTLPCFRIPQMLVFPSNINKRPGATLEVVVKYSLYHLNLKFLRRSQTFHFKSVAAKDKSQHWEFLN
jgi:hypothetical protein